MISEKIKEIMALDWRRRAIAVFRLHEEQQNQHGATLNGIKGGWGQADTAKLMNTSTATICQDIRIAEVLLRNSGKFDNVRSRNHALRVIEEDTDIRVEIKNATMLVMGTVKRVITVEGYDYYFVKLDKVQRTNAGLEIETIFLPVHHFKVVRD